MDPSKTVILITGANSGVGYETAKLLSSNPKYHIIVGARTVEKGERAISEIKSSSPKSTVSSLLLDITSEDSIDKAVATIENDFGRLDVLVNNAGIIPQSEKLRDALKEVFETNTFAHALVTEAFTPLLSKSKDARIIYVTSSIGSISLRSNPKDAYYNIPAVPYRMSKAALNMLAACDRAKGWKVWAYCPGFVFTPLYRMGEKAEGMGSPASSAPGIAAIVAGERDEDVGKFVHKDGVYDW